MHLNPDNIYERLTLTGDEWCEANAGAELFESSTKILLSNLIAQAPEGSMASKEAWAYRHPDYKEHVEVMVNARRVANKAKVKYESAKTWADCKRTEAANMRATMREAP